MKSISFKQQNTVFSKDQPHYAPLPACVARDSDEASKIYVTSCWKLTLRERLKLIFTGTLFDVRITFESEPGKVIISPTLLSVDEPKEYFPAPKNNENPIRRSIDYLKKLK